MNIMLYFGSFNPIHNGHLAIAEWVVERGLCDEIWLVVSPQNPFKVDAELAPEADRLRMAELAVAGSAHRDRIRVSDAEFHLPRPSYTVDTLAELQRRYPKNTFSVLIGSDNVDRIDHWKEFSYLLAHHQFFVYPRAGSEHATLREGMTLLEGAPLWDFSSTDVRAALAAGRNAESQSILPMGVCNYVKINKLWSYEE